MTLPAFERDWRQFRLLSRDSVRRLLETVAQSRDVDPMQLAIWGTALALTPPFLLAVRKILEYPFLLRAPTAVVARYAMADRLFFIIYGMLATAIFTALTWDALFPNRTDQEIVGVLPVRPRTLAAARLGASARVGTVFAAAINAPAGLIYSAASSVHPAIGSFPRVLFAHVVSTTLASAFVFFGLMSARALVAICAGERVASKLATVLQFVTIVLLVEVFLFLPAVLPTLVTAMQSGDPRYASLPPVWFGALYAWIGEGHELARPGAWIALGATLASAIALLILALVPASLMARRALETQPGERASSLTLIARVIARLFIWKPAVRSLFLFAVASLTRSPRHMLMLATYSGFALAVGIIDLVDGSLRGTLWLDQPQAHLLALPLVFTFFAVFGLRAALAVPTDIDANWPFRMSQPRIADAIAASGLVVIVFGVLPIALATLVAGLMIWPAEAAWRIAAFDLVSGIALTDAVLVRWTKVPFATAHGLATEAIRTRWPWFLIFLIVYGFKLAGLQVTALESTENTAMYLIVGLAAIVLIRAWRHHRTRLRTLTFDLPEESGIEVLNLSGAST